MRSSGKTNPFNFLHLLQDIYCIIKSMDTVVIMLITFCNIHLIFREVLRIFVYEAEK
jgi:hypothetical protein